MRVLIAKPGLDGHETGAKLIARALANAGVEVIYTGTRQTPEMIVTAALQEDVNLVGLSILSGAHMELCFRVLTLFRKEGQSDLPIIVGGIIPDEDIPALKAMGINQVFGPGTLTQQVVDYVRGLVGVSR